MAFSILLFFFFCSIVIHHAALTVAQEPPILKQICVEDRASTPETVPFERNLKHLLASIPKINNGFYRASYGEKQNQVNAMAFCRGDVKPVDCRRCITRSSFKLQKQCTNQKEAVIWYDNCMLRYSNRYFFGNLEFGPRFWMYNEKMVPNPGGFTRALTLLFRKLKLEAASGSSSLKYATGSTATSRNSPMVIYALVQCAPDLSKWKCIDCVNQAIALLPQCCKGRQGGRVVAPSCNFRYEINRSMHDLIKNFPEIIRFCLVRCKSFCH